MASRELCERCRDAVAAGLHLGADEIEVFGQAVDSVNATVEKDDLQISKSRFETSFGVRALVGRRVGFASTNDAARLDTACADAVALARISPADPHNVLPEPETADPVDGLHDPAADAFEAADAVRKTVEILDRVGTIDQRVIVNDAWFDAERVASAVANSRGLAVEERGSLFTYGLVATAREGETVSSFDFQFGASRTVAGIDIETPTARACASALASLGAERGESFVGPVLLSPQAVADLVLGPILFQISARNVLRGRSRWRDAIGTTVAVPGLHLADDGREAGGVATGAFDREGVPHRRLALIESGVLRFFLHNAYSAHAMGEANTGHATGSARSVPAIGPTNLSILPGEGSVDDLVADVEQGLLVRRFSGNANPISGDFSGAVKSAQLIRNGKLGRAVSGTLIAGNVFDALSTLSAISADRERVYNYTLPFLQLEKVSVTAKG